MNTTEQPFAQTSDTKIDYLGRFRRAREGLGPTWKKKMGERYPFYETRTGEIVMNAAVNALRDPKYIGKERLEALVIAMESLNIDQPTS